MSDQTRLVATGAVVPAGQSSRLFTMVLHGGAGGAGTVQFLDGGAGAPLFWEVGTDAASQVREFSAKGIKFSNGMWAILGANIDILYVEWI